ncbi:hypothetical protein RJ641_011259 [Dillenia turbinata]|uniref:Uncharacterized protein n=1 Tax=Dillenia turbinata TaxID=194707 RepID=A0AAN8UW30_9MAGN
MTDIAMLVAEEYERRIKNAKKRGEEREEVRFVNHVSVAVKRVDGPTSSLRTKVGEGKAEIAKQDPTP